VDDIGIKSERQEKFFVECLLIRKKLNWLEEGFQECLPEKNQQSSSFVRRVTL
jgi:hypothetical protein